MEGNFSNVSGTGVVLLCGFTQFSTVVSGGSRIFRRGALTSQGGC